MRCSGDLRHMALAAAVTAVTSIVACGDRSDRSAGKGNTTTGAPSSPAVPANTAAPAPTATSPSTPSTAAASAPAPTPGSTIAASDREFITLAASSGALEVETGRLALEKSKNANVRTFAQHMVDGHSTTSESLRQVASAVRAAPAVTMAPPHAAHLEKLRALSGAEFDREYAAQIGVAAHQEAVALFERASREAANADVRGFAEKTLPALRNNLQDGQTLAKNVGVPAERMKTANSPPDLSSLSAMVQGTDASKSATQPK
jgi:putative membrane protein